MLHLAAQHGEYYRVIARHESREPHVAVPSYQMTMEILMKAMMGVQTEMSESYDIIVYTFSDRQFNANGLNLTIEDFSVINDTGC